MSTHFLVDFFATPLASASLLSAHSPPNGESLAQGAFVVVVPDSVSVVNPVDLGDLLTKKYQGLLASFAGFTQIVYDDLLDTSGLNLGASGTKGVFGDRGTILPTSLGQVYTAATPLVGPPVAQAVVTWENFTLTDSDPASGTMARTFQEVTPDPSVMVCQVSVNGGLSFTSATNGSVINFAPADQGNSLVVRWQNVTSGRVGLGSWAFIY